MIINIEPEPFLETGPDEGDLTWKTCSVRFLF